MRITFLLTQSLDSPAGLRYGPLARELVHLGHKVTILALHHDFGSSRHHRYSEDGVLVHYVSQMHVLKRAGLKSHFSPLRFVQVAALATWRLTRAALAVGTDAYHVCKPHPMNAIAGWTAARVKRAHLYVDCDDYEAVSNRYSIKWQQPVVRWFEDWLPRQCDGVTTNTHFTEERLRNLGVPAHRIVYVPNGVERARFEAVAGCSPADTRSELGLTGHPVILYLGTLSLASHPVDLLIDAFGHVHQHVPEAVLLLVGGGDDLSELQAQVERLNLQAATRFLGQVSPARAVDLLRIADVSVDPVRKDLIASARLPLKVVESMMAGTPIVTGDVGDRRQILADGKAGLLVEPGSATALAAGILSLVENPRLAKQLGSEGLRQADLYRWERLVHDFVRVYES